MLSLHQYLFGVHYDWCYEVYTQPPMQIGKVRLPFYLAPDYPEHKNPGLTAIFNPAVPAVAAILAVFDGKHPVIASYNKYFAEKKTIERHQDAGKWMDSLRLVPTPELEAVLLEPVGSLLKHQALAHLLEPERHQKVMAVGSALLQLLAVQHVLGEPSNLNGDIMNDLAIGNVDPYFSDGPEALRAMFPAITWESSKGEKLTTDMVRFNAAHAIYDPEFRPPTFRRERSSQSEATAPIHITAKRKKDKEIELRSTKRRKEEAAASLNPGRKPTRKKQSRVSAAPASKSVQIAKRSKRRWPGYVELDSDGIEVS
ncbi:hypothetical protein K438DRAFT_1939789 [Mycena galopus ATCC 62051]|nr:hypothetical protein K438DRAFT_1939789 [Mycena galopus ATCC 62051]